MFIVDCLCYYRMSVSFPQKMRPNQQTEKKNTFKNISDNFFLLPILRGYPALRSPLIFSLKQSHIYIELCSGLNILNFNLKQTKNIFSR